ncbi:MAG: DUF1648 domain-containing protein [Proteobacteria bacterium]|nr:DUF1648 domain-containing protein [Pseudomonadota bacterium]
MLPHIVFTLLIAVCAARVVTLWPALPERIAVHFDAAGRPNGWSSREGLIGILALQFGLFALIFLSAGGLKWLPDRNLRLPNKDYWLDPQRRDSTFEFIALWLRWFLLLVFGFVSWLTLRALEANLTATPHLEVTNSTMVAFATIAAAMIVGLIGRFAWRG